jgi:hypothetical protein
MLIGIRQIAQIISSPIDLSYGGLAMADIEVQKVFKGVHRQKQLLLKHNSITKLISGSDRSERVTSPDRDCDGERRTLHHLQIGHPYVFIGNFSEGRLFVNGCEYLRLTVHLPNKDRQLLQSEITC